MQRQLVVAVVMLLLTGCATQRYEPAVSPWGIDRAVPPVSPGERSSFTCEQIVLEIEKTEFFITDIQRHRRNPDWAELSGMKRLRQLKALRSEKGC